MNTVHYICNVNILLLCLEFYMSNKEIQEKRMKGYFIESAKEIIKGEGIRSVSVRNIAERAGYSFATLYNYFTDVKELLYFCIEDFIDESHQFVKSARHPEAHGIERIKSISKAYSNYFVQYTGIYDLMFNEKMSPMLSYDKISLLLTSYFEELFADEWNACVAEGIFSEDSIVQRKEAHNYQLHGALMFYINRRFPADYSEFLKRIESNLDLILKQ